MKKLDRKSWFPHLRSLSKVSGERVVETWEKLLKTARKISRLKSRSNEIFVRTKSRSNDTSNEVPVAFWEISLANSFERQSGSNEKLVRTTLSNDFPECLKFYFYPRNIISKF